MTSVSVLEADVAQRYDFKQVLKTTQKSKLKAS